MPHFPPVIFAIAFAAQKLAKADTTLLALKMERELGKAFLAQRQPTELCSGKTGCAGGR